MLRISVNDRVSYGITKRTYTDEGFLVVPGRVARSGIQQYLASELGLMDRDPNELINVYRPSDEVFNIDSLASYEASDVTLEHPSEMVNAINYNSTSVGVVHGVAVKDDDFVLANLIIKSKDAVEAVESGKVQLSAGYTALYDNSPGMTEDGQSYEFVQRDIKINHIAICNRARAGAQARLYDNLGVPTMIKVMLDSGLALEVADEASAKLVTDAFQDMTKKINDAESKADKADAEKEDMKEKLDEEKKKSSDSAITERVQLIAQTMDQARKIVGDTFTCDSVDVPTIQRVALTAKRPTVDWAAKSDTYVQTGYELAFDDAEIAPIDNAEQLAKFSKDAANLEQKKTEPKLTRDQAYAKKLSTQWENK